MTEDGRMPKLLSFEALRGARAWLKQTDFHPRVHKEFQITGEKIVSVFSEFQDKEVYR